MAIPLFHVADLERALAFYVGTLGACVGWREPGGQGPGFAALALGEHELYLSSHAGDGVAGAVAYFAVPDLDIFFHELCGRGYIAPLDRGPVYAGPFDQSWGSRELYVRDVDDNCLRFVVDR